MTQKKTGRWKPGESGNPAGKPKGSGTIQKMRAALSEAIPDVTEALLEKARDGDVAAARLLLERVFPPARPEELPRAFDLPAGTLTEQGKALLDLVATGEISPSQGAQLIGALGNLSKVAEVDDLATRVAALEEANRGKS